MGRLTTSLAVVAAALLLTATACGERREPTGPDVSPYPVTVQGAGDQETTLRRRPTRIAPLDPAVATMLIELDAQKQLVGLPHPGTPSIWTLNGGGLARALVRLHPDLIVASTATDPVDLARAGKATGAPVYLIPEETAEDIDTALTQLGLLTDHPVVARAFLRKNREAVKGVETATTNEPVLRVFVDTGGFTTVSSRTLFSDLMRIAHGSNIAGRHPEPGVFEVRKLVRLDPQVYLTTDRTLTLADLKKGKRTRRLTAVRTGNFHYIPLRYMTPDGDLGARLNAIARLLHPDALR
jgi:ABC-type Fe3+-hydroxamate transport system substrate-binding protein